MWGADCLAAALDLGRVPVIERGTDRLLAIMRRADVLRAYQSGFDATSATSNVSPPRTAGSCPLFDAAQAAAAPGDVPRP